MRVAQFIDTNTPGGAETIVLELCRQLAAKGLEPVLLHFGSDYLSERIEQYGIEQHRVPGWKYYKSFKTLPQFIRRFQRFLREQHIDVLHSHLYGPITAAAPACRLAGIHHIGTLHDVYVVAERPARLYLLQLAALLGTRLVCVSKDMEAFYRARARFSAKAMQTIYNGTPNQPSAAPPDLRQSLALAESDLVIICVSRLVSLKNHHMLLAAFSGLDPSLSAKLLLVGDGPMQTQLEQEAQQLGIAEQLRFLGRRNDIAELLAISDFFTLASNTEGLSCSVLEAMGAGLPAVVTTAGGNPELIAEGVSGFLVEPGDTIGFQQRLQTLAQDPQLRRQQGLAARQRAVSMFSFDRMIENYLRLYAAPSRLQQSVKQPTQSTSKGGAASVNETR